MQCITLHPIPFHPVPFHSIPLFVHLTSSRHDPQVTQVALDRASQHRTEAAICTDREAINACVAFAADHRILVEPACGAGLAVAYSPRLRKMLQGLPSAVIEVCGGSGVNLELLGEWDSTVA